MKEKKKKEVQNKSSIKVQAKIFGYILARIFYLWSWTVLQKDFVDDIICIFLCKDRDRNETEQVLLG